MVDSFAPVVIDDLHVMSIPVNPAKADAPLIVDADAVLALSTTLERLKPIGRRNSQILKCEGIAEHASKGLRQRGQVHFPTAGRGIWLRA
jgi:hypothetical protein